MVRIIDLLHLSFVVLPQTRGLEGALVCQELPKRIGLAGSARSAACAEGDPAALVHGVEDGDAAHGTLLLLGEHGGRAVSAEQLVAARQELQGGRVGVAEDADVGVVRLGVGAVLEPEGTDDVFEGGLEDGAGAAEDGGRGGAEGGGGAGEDVVAGGVAELGAVVVEEEADQDADVVDGVEGAAGGVEDEDGEDDEDVEGVAAPESGLGDEEEEGGEGEEEGGEDGPDGKAPEGGEKPDDETLGDEGAEEEGEKDDEEVAEEAEGPREAGELEAFAGGEGDGGVI